MKIRKDFVTNSSSSSFIIDKKQLTYGQLLKYLLEIAKKEAKFYEGRGKVGWKDVEKDCVAGRYIITEGTTDNPYVVDESDYDWNISKEESKKNERRYTNHYIVDNDGNVRYDWNIVEEVLDKHGIDFERGYCD